MSTATARNPWADKRRSTKALLIADKLWDSLSDSDRLSPDLVGCVRLMPTALRNGWANVAGVHAPSDETWAAVVARVELLVKREMGRARWRAS